MTEDPWNKAVRRLINNPTSKAVFAPSPAPVGDGLVELAAEWEEWCTGPHNPFHTLLRRTQKALRESAATITRLEQRERELVEGVKRIEQFALDGKSRTAIGAIIEIAQIARALLKDTKL